MHLSVKSGVFGTMKLAKKILTLIIPLYIIWLLYIEYLPDYYNEANNTRWQFMHENFEDSTKLPNASILFLGESRVNAGIDFTQFHNAWSFASGGATSAEMYYALTKYLEKHPRPDTVFLSISPRFLCETFAFYPYAVRNNFFNVADMKELSELYKQHPEDTILGDFPLLRFGLYKADYLEYYQKDISKNYGFRAKHKNAALRKDMIRRKGGRFHPNLKDSCAKLNYETRYLNFNPAPILDTYLHKIFERCASEHIKLIFENMPMNEASVNALHPKFKSDFEQYLQKIQQNYPDAEVADSLYAYPNGMFGDASHLNRKGKQKFTNYLMQKFKINALQKNKYDFAKN